MHKLLPRASLLAATTALAALCPLTSQAAAPQLRVLSPQGAQRGTESLVLLDGPRIGLDPQDLLWHEPGIELTKLERVNDNQVKVSLAVPDSLPPGRYPLRVRTATGISNVMTFHVGDLPEVSEAEPNSSPREPQAVELGVVISGVVKREDTDFYAFEAVQDQVISIEVDGLRLGRAFFDPVVMLYGPDGEMLARCDDWPLVRQDACLSVVAPADGRYLVELRESAYRGDDNCTYRLHLGNFPRPLAVYPPGGRVGETVDLTWIGDAGPEVGESIALPDVPTDEYAYVPTSDRGVAPSPHLLRVVDMPVTRESEPNDHPTEANAGEAAGAFCGIIKSPGDIDHFRFAAKKDQVLDLRVHARDIGSPLDTVLRVRSAEGKFINANDDDRGLPDSYIRFKVPADGEYVLQVEDRLGRGGETFIYWIEARGPEPSVEMQLEEQQRYVAKLLDVPRGGRNGAVLKVDRQNTGGALALDWKHLPSGVSVEMFPLAANFNRLPVVFSATDDAPLAAGLATPTAHRTEDHAAIASDFTQVNLMTRGQNNRDMWNYTDSRVVVAVTEKAPYSLRIEQPQAPLVQRGDMELKVVAQRAEGFDEAILVRMLYNPPGVSSNNSRRIKQGETEAVIPVTANDKAGVGDWKIVVRGEAEAQGKLVTTTPIASLTIAEPYVAMELPRPNIEQGGSVEFSINVEQRTPFEGEARVELMNLPPGVTTEPQTITKDTGEVRFVLQAAGDARLGRHKGLFCRVTVPVDGEQVRHSVGYGELRVDMPLKPSETATASRR